MLQNRKINKFLCGLLVFTLLVCFWHPAYGHNANEGSIVPIMSKIQVKQKFMSTCVLGSGDKTIVLLSGLATGNPIEDFYALANKLSDTYKVVIIEYFGLGKSDDTDEERSSENIIEETRAALKSLKIEPPYILMPHSISGIYSLWYVKNYPREVEAIVGIDTSKPNVQKEFYESNENAIRYFSQNLDKDKVSIATFNEAAMFYKNSQEFFDAQYPEKLPVLSFISAEQIELIKSRRSLTNGNKVTDWDILAQNMISNPKIQKNEILQGSHYLHHEASDEIVTKTKNFLNIILNKK